MNGKQITAGIMENNNTVKSKRKGVIIISIFILLNILVVGLVLSWRL